jgi:hypothetical protein
VTQHELGASLIEDDDADHVARQQIAGELDAAHLTADGSSQRAR